MVFSSEISSSFATCSSIFRTDTLKMNFFNIQKMIWGPPHAQDFQPKLIFNVFVLKMLENVANDELISEMKTIFLYDQYFLRYDQIKFAEKVHNC